MYKSNKKISKAIDDNRIFILFAIVFIIMSIFAPSFLNIINLSNILKGACLGAMVAIGFTLVLICGQLDLSIGMTLNLGSIVVIGLCSTAGWILSIPAAILAGAAVGLCNGLLVTKGKIHAFIVTLGMMITVKGILYMITGSASISVSDFSLSDWLGRRVLLIFTPKILITLAVILLFEFFLKKTKQGRIFYLVGGNKETAWLGGFNTDKFIIIAFAISGAVAALGGVLFAIELGSAVPNMGEKGVNPQLLVIASVIIGGASMMGGKGSVIKSAFAVMTLMMLFNGLSCFGTGYEVQIFSSGLILAVVVMYEAFSQYREDLMRGQRIKLLEEIKRKV